MIFNRENSTLGIMDDLQIAVHTYDGCGKGCPGCIVDTHFKNRRFMPILTKDDMVCIDNRVREYYKWITENINTKNSGYFGENGFKVNHYSYTFRFGNHSELSIEQLKDISLTLEAPFKVFSTAPTDDISRFYELTKPENNPNNSRIFLEIIYDPIADNPNEVRNMILDMRKHGIMGYPEILITKRLLDFYGNPEEFVAKCIEPFGDIETQVQFGRYSPSKTRKFNIKQVVSVDTEVEWLRGVASSILRKKLNIHPIPIAEYAVTFIDEYGETDLTQINQEEDFDLESVINKTRDIFYTSLYIDHNLDLYVWSESMGQHVLDSNFGFPKLGNIKDKSISEILTDPNGVLEKMLQQNIAHLLKHKKCSGCKYKSFCSSHAIPFFRKFMEDDGKDCYGYLPVIREFQKDPVFLQNMIDGFKRLEF